MAQCVPAACPPPPSHPGSSSRSSSTVPQLLRPSPVSPSCLFLLLLPTVTQSLGQQASPGTSVSRNLPNSPASLHPSGPSPVLWLARAVQEPPRCLPHFCLPSCHTGTFRTKTSPPGSPRKPLQWLRRLQNKSQTLTPAPWDQGLPQAQHPSFPRLCLLSRGPPPPPPEPWRAPRCPDTPGPRRSLHPAGPSQPRLSHARSPSPTCQVRVPGHLGGGKASALPRPRSVDSSVRCLPQWDVSP